MKKILLFLVPCFFLKVLEANDSFSKMRQLGYTPIIYTSETIWSGRLEEMKKTRDVLDVSICVSLGRPNTETILNSTCLRDFSKFTAYLEIGTNVEWGESSIETVERHMKNLYDLKKIGESSISCHSILCISRGVDNISEYMDFLKTINPFLKAIEHSYILEPVMDSIDLKRSRLEQEGILQRIWRKMCSFGKVLPSKRQVKFADPIRNSM